MRTIKVSPKMSKIKTFASEDTKQMKDDCLYDETLKQFVGVASASIKARLNLKYSKIKAQKGLNYSQKWEKRKLRKES